MSLELTDNKSSIGSGALNDLVFILYCRVIGQWLPTRRRSVGNQLGSDWQPIGDWSATVSWAFVYDCRKSATFWRSVGNRSATGRRLKTVSGLSTTAATGRRSVANQSATCRQPPKTFLRSIWSQRGFTCSNQNLLATESSLQPSATGRRLVADLLATALQPPCNHSKFWSQGGRRPVASYVWPGLYEFRHRIWAQSDQQFVCKNNNKKSLSANVWKLLDK